MPIYEFYSPDTHKIYSFLARRLLTEVPIPQCPDGAQHRMEKMVSRFSFTGRAKEPSATANDPELDPRQEAAMMEMAREMESMGDDNPDPKVLGRMMRKMMDITGQKAPGEMEEMLRRLESGEDPEKLEEEFGDAMDQFDLPGEGDETAAGDLKRALSRRLRRAPTRDPHLYELSDFLPKEKTRA
jgi:hypothetical protein